MLKGRHQKTLDAMRQKPTPRNITWTEFKALFLALGATLHEGGGSHVKFELEGRTLSTYRPHKTKEMLQYQLQQAEEFIRNTVDI